MDLIKVMVVGDQQEEKSSIMESLSNVEYITVSEEAETAEEALEILERSFVEVALVDAYISGDGYRLAEKITLSHPEVAVIIIERELREETMRKAMFAGAKDVLLYPFTPSKLVDSIYRSHQLERKKKSLSKGKSSSGRKKSRQGRILPVFSTKGGAGKTFVSANLAVSLAQHTGEKVVLVDLDLDFGNAALALNIMPRYSISDVINEIRNLDQDLIESYLIPHRSGIKLLAANAQPQMTEFINAEHVGMILKTLQSAFDYVVVDMPARFYDPVDPAIQEADLLFIVTTPEVATLRNVKSCMNTFELLKYPRNKIKVLLNKAESRDEIKPKDVEATLNTSLYGILHADYRSVNSSLNQGIPVVLFSPRSKITRDFRELARRVSGQKASRGPVEAVAAEPGEEMLQEVKG